jgi:hypothetical protein
MITSALAGGVGRALAAGGVLAAGAVLGGGALVTGAREALGGGALSVTDVALGEGGGAGTRLHPAPATRASATRASATRTSARAERRARDDMLA